MNVTPSHQSSSANFRIVDLFAGPGGLDVAADVLGIPSTGVEWDANACETRKRAGLKTLGEDVTKHGPACFPHANVLAGGPPCQTFSVAGNGVGREALDSVLEFTTRLAERKDRAKIDEDLKKMDVRTSLVLQPLRWVLDALDTNELRPFEAIVLEQVQTVLPVWEAFGEVFEKNGYSVDTGILRTERFGVPQTRKRAILIACRDGRRAYLPQPTHHPYRKDGGRQDSDFVLSKWVAMEDELPALRSRGRFKVISNYGTGGDPKARGVRLSCEPSFTVTGKNSRNRVIMENGEETRFSNQEAGRLQTFPDAYPWSGREIAQQIGNAVPPRLGIHVLSAALGLAPPGDVEWKRLREWTPPIKGEELLTPCCGVPEQRQEPAGELSTDGELAAGS
ncbi:DNA cytosine methyltransferase [Streptomyces sp. HNM0575]|uniref:DNA cytosine methyltransferase n=1 Tax=Streptomyces sp. HNM0575 TaxID=2716338 RepID=UPI00145DF663|nr:DNA cytosine methyltransferase [Streptomyces sp. HNM0575]NLU74403.1 DNA cytosine methyltransferase [Streptomyces sp. HNM0575]